MNKFVDVRRCAPLTPTLVIGLGGTGVKVVRRVKGALRRYFADRNLGDVPPVMRFLAIDSVPLSNQHGETELTRDEYIYLGQVDGGKVISNPRFQPEIAAWWDQERSAPGHIDNGCGQMRDVGRLVFFYHYQDFLARLNNQIDTIQRQSTVFDTEYRGFQLRPNQMRICVVSSIAGGTGSGTFLDATYNVHHLIGRMRGVTATVEGYLVLPEVYLDSLPSTAMRESVQANGYAALAELEFLNRYPERAKEVFHAYPGAHTINPQRRPFDHTFLVGLRDQDGYGLSSPEEAYDAISQAIYLEAVYLDQAMTENTANVFADSDIGGDIGNTGFGRYYSSFSVSAVGVRQDIALDYCRRRLALSALHDLLVEQTAQDGDLPAPPEDLSAGSLVQNMEERILNTRPLPDPVDRHEAESKPLLEALDRNEKDLQAWMNDAVKPLQDAARAKQRELREYVSTQAWEIAVRRGINSVFPYLRAWLRALQQSSENLRERAGELDRRSEELHRAYEHDRAELEEIALGPGIAGVLAFNGTARRRHRREQLFDDARKSVRAYQEARFKRETVRQIHSTVVHSLLGDTVEDDYGSIARLLKQWELLREAFQGIQLDVQRTLDDVLTRARRLEAGEQAYAVAHDISLTQAELEALYQEIQDTLQPKDLLAWVPQAVAAADPDGVETGRRLRDQVRELLLSRAQQICLPVFAGDESQGSLVEQAHRSVQMALSHSLGTYISRSAVLNELFEYNVPFWSYSGVTDLDNVLERTNLVAVESRSPEGWQSTDPDDILSLGRGEERLRGGVESDHIVETGDPSLLAVYRASYGLPVFLLNSIPDLHAQYERRRLVKRNAQGKKQGLSLHLTAAWNDEPPVDLTRDIEGGAVLSELAD